MDDFEIRDTRISWENKVAAWGDDDVVRACPSCGGKGELCQTCNQTGIMVMVWKETGKPVKESDIITFPIDCGCGEGSACFNVWWEKVIKK